MVRNNEMHKMIIFLKKKEDRSAIPYFQEKIISFQAINAQD
jgi:hypothetical protein